jgi:hypothetical protein
MIVIDDLIAAGEVLSPGVRAVISERESRIRELQARLGQSSRNSSRPLSPDLLGSKREKKKPSGRKRGG